MNVVMIIPTGIGCEIGGHAGDATPAARLLGSVCDKLFLHPNVVNASDINEMPGNALYVEGSMLDRFLEGHIELQEILSNRILVVTNSPIRNETINAVSAARVTIGVEARILVLDTPLQMIAKYDGRGCATGDVLGWEELVEQVWKYDFDALAIATPITLDNEIMLKYLREGGVNPMGGVEAKASKLIAERLNLPVAHSPTIEDVLELHDYNEITKPALAAEVVSLAFLHCIMKGLHKAPQIGKGWSVEDVDVMVSPYGCWGRPHEACKESEIPIIIVKENRTIFSHGNYPLGRNSIFVENYLEAAGVIAAMKSGIALGSLHRPIKYTEVINA